MKLKLCLQSLECFRLWKLFDTLFTDSRNNIHPTQGVETPTIHRIFSLKRKFTRKSFCFLFLALVSCFCSCFCVFALVSCFVHLFLKLVHMSKYLINWAEMHVLRVINCSFQVRNQIWPFSSRFWVLGCLRNFKKFVKILKLSSKKL